MLPPLRRLAPCLSRPLSCRGPLHGRSCRHRAGLLAAAVCLCTTQRLDVTSALSDARSLLCLWGISGGQWGDPLSSCSRWSLLRQHVSTADTCNIRSSNAAMWAVTCLALATKSRRWLPLVDAPVPASVALIAESCRFRRWCLFRILAYAIPMKRPGLELCRHSCCHSGRYLFKSRCV